MKNTPEKWGITLDQFDDPTATWGRTIIKDPSVGSNSYFYDNLPVRLQRGLLTKTGDYDNDKIKIFFLNKAQQVIDGIVFYRSILQKIKDPVFTSLPVETQSYTKRSVLQVINYALQNSYDEKTAGSNVAVSGLTISDNLSSWINSKAMFGTAAGTSLMLSGLHKMTIDGDQLKYDDKLLTINFDGNHTLTIDGIQHTLAEWLKIGHQEDLAELEKKVEKNSLDIDSIPTGNIVDLTALAGTKLWDAFVKNKNKWIMIKDNYNRYYILVSSGRKTFSHALAVNSSSLVSVYIHDTGAISTGRISYSITPVLAYEVTNKQYVDQSIISNPQTITNTASISSNQAHINNLQALINNLKALNIEGQLLDDVADNNAMIALKADKNDWVHNIAQQKYYKFDGINWIEMSGLNGLLASAKTNKNAIAKNLNEIAVMYNNVTRNSLDIHNIKTIKYDDITNLIHLALDNHKNELGITTDDRIHKNVVALGLTNAKLKAYYDGATNDNSRIYVILNPVAAQLATGKFWNILSTPDKTPYYALNGNINDTKNILFNHILKPELERVRGDFALVKVLADGILNIMFELSQNKKTIFLYFSASNFAKGWKIDYNIDSGNWGRLVLIRQAIWDMDKIIFKLLFVYKEALSEKHTYIKDFDDNIVSLHQFLKNEFEFHAGAGKFRTGVTKLLVTSKGNVSPQTDRKAGLSNKWSPAVGLINVEEHHSLQQEIVWDVTTPSATIKPGIYKIFYKQTFYDIDVSGITGIRVSISGVEKTDYHLADFNTTNIKYNNAQNSITFDLEVEGYIKVLKNVTLTPQLYIPNNNARTSGQGHYQSVIANTRQNEFKIERVDSGVEIDPNAS